MQKLAAVGEAKALFQEATDWGVWRWLTEKRRVREAADAAWEALEECERKVRAGCPREAIRKLKELDEQTHKLRIDAEAQFDEADRRMSASMAREGSQMAIEAWSAREKFIRKLESAARKKED
jgi:hypothetical protein